MKKYPQFVSMGGNTALRLVNAGDSYWYKRDGGDWDIDFYERNGSLFSSSHIESLDNKLLKPITESEWRKCNGQYAPKYFTRFGYELADVSTQNSVNNYKYLLIK